MPQATSRPVLNKAERSEATLKLSERSERTSPDYEEVQMEIQFNDPPEDETKRVERKRGDDGESDSERVRETTKKKQ